MTVAEVSRPVVPQPAAGRELAALSRQAVSTCYQCEKCTNGCPVTAAMDIKPHQVMHLLNLGLMDRVLRSDTIWVCASCETCTARCPNSIDFAHIMDTLRQLSQQKGIKPVQYSVPIFHSAFLSSVKRHGRLHETELALTYSIEDAGWLGFIKLAGLGFGLFLRGKIRLIPNRVRAMGKIREIFKRSAEVKV